MDRSIDDIMDSQKFLEIYGNTPVESIDVENARLKLQRLGILTKTNKISAKYGNIVVKSKSASNVASHKRTDKKEK